MSAGPTQEVQVWWGGHRLGCGHPAVACDCAEIIYEEFRECPECGGPLDDYGLCQDRVWQDCMWTGQG